MLPREREQHKMGKQMNLQIDKTEEDSLNESLVLSLRSSTTICAIPIKDISEVMRPLPLNVIPDSPIFLLGISVIRGHSIPIVDFGTLVGLNKSKPPEKYVVLKVESRKVALAVENVMGIKKLSRGFMDQLPPLFQNVHPDIITQIGILDEEFLIVIRASKLIPIEVWDKISQTDVGKV